VQSPCSAVSPCASRLILMTRWTRLTAADLEQQHGALAPSAARCIRVSDRHAARCAGTCLMPRPRPGYVLRSCTPSMRKARPTRRSRGAALVPTWRIRPFWVGAASGLGTATVAATLAFLLLAPPLTTRVVDELLGAHVEFVAVDTSDRRRVHGPTCREAMVCRSHGRFTGSSPTFEPQG